MTFPILQLRKNESRRLLAGHLWVFSNEVDTQATPLGNFKPGETVTVVGSKGEKIGNALVNPHALICARLFSRNSRQGLDREFLEEQIRSALLLREKYFSLPFYRLIYGESDFLPGLIVDRFDNTIVVQTATLGMELLRSTLIEALDAVLNPEVIILKNDLGSRNLEALDSYVEVLKGSPAEKLRVSENNAQFDVSTLLGQKTGWFYDHRNNRKSMQSWVNGCTVLDVFSYVGGWGIQAGIAGAADVHCIESSAPACELIRSNADLNDVSGKIHIVQQDAFDALSAMAEERKKFDVIVLDPPAFIKRKKDIKQGTNAYQRLNKLAMRLLTDPGILISASCSFHFPRNEHLKVLRDAAYKSGYRLQILGENNYAPDHPIHPAISETDYLTCFTLRVLKD